MEALAAGGLAEADEADRLKTIPQIARRLDHIGEGDLRSGIEIEDETARRVGVVRLAVPGMEFDSACLGERDQPFGPVNLEIGFLVVADLDEFQQARRARHRMALEKLLVLDAVRCAHHRAGPTFQMGDHPLTDALEVMSKIELGDSFARLRLRPKLLVRMRNGDCSDERLHGFSRRL